MENNKFTPETICQGAKIYNIPIYQRLFAWDEANVMQLLDDLKDLFTSWIVSNDSRYCHSLHLYSNVIMLRGPP